MEGLFVWWTELAGLLRVATAVVAIAAVAGLISLDGLLSVKAGDWVYYYFGSFWSKTVRLFLGLPFWVIYWVVHTLWRIVKFVWEWPERHRIGMLIKHELGLRGFWVFWRFWRPDTQILIDSHLRDLAKKFDEDAKRQTDARHLGRSTTYEDWRVEVAKKAFWNFHGLISQKGFATEDTFGKYLA